MRFSTLTVAALFSAVFATPLPEPEADASAALVPGVNITNAGIAGTAQAVKNSYIVVFKGDASDADVEKHEKGVGKKLGKGPKDKYKLNGWKGYHLETDRAGLAKVATDPLVSPSSTNSVTKVLIDENRLHMSSSMQLPRSILLSSTQQM